MKCHAVIHSRISGTDFIGLHYFSLLFAGRPTSSVYSKVRRTYACKAVVALVLFALLTISLSLSIPVYYKGTIIPDVGK